MSDQPKPSAASEQPGPSDAANIKKAEIVEKAFKNEKFEKIEHKEKPEKIEHKEKPEKIEHKEKPEKWEHKEKPEKFEHKEKPEKWEHKEKFEIKEISKIELREKDVPEVFQPGDPLGDPVEQRLARLEAGMASVNHFITTGQRPDLSRGALASEPPAPKATKPGG